MNRERSGPSGRSQGNPAARRALAACRGRDGEARRAYRLGGLRRLQADGGTRTAAITGSFIAMADAIGTVVRAGALPGTPVRDCVAAISVGIVGARPRST